MTSSGAPDRAYSQSFDDRVANVIDTAAHLPAFAARLEEAGLSPADLRTAKSLASLPIQSKDDVLEAQRLDPPFGGLLGPDADVVRFFQSPGPLYEPQLSGPDPWRWAPSLKAAGFGPQDTVLNCFGYHLSPAGMMFDEACTALGSRVVPGGIGSGELQAQAISNLSLTAYTGLPTRTVETADVRAPEASTLRWALQFSVAPTRAWLQVEHGPRIDLQEREGIWRAAHRIDRPALYRIVSEPALPAAQRRLHRIDMIGDEPPQVRATTPTQSLSLRKPGQLAWPVVFEAIDDYGVAARAELRIIQTSGEGENISASERTLSLNASGPARKRRFAYVFDLARSGLTVGNDVIVQLSVRDTRQPRPQTVRSASVILRWPPEEVGMATGLDGLMLQVLPAYFRSQRQIIIDAEKLIGEQRKISADVFTKRSDAIGVDQHVLRLRYGQFLGEEAEETKPLPTSDTDHEADADADAVPAQDAEHSAEDQHGHGETGNSGVDAMLAQVSHEHDLPEAATMLDPQTKEILREALREMWSSETQLRLGQPQKALPYANKALVLIKKIQQADRIYLPRMGSELPPIDFSRRMSGSRVELATRSNAFVAVPDIAMPLDALWRALGADHDRSEIPATVLEDASRWLQVHAGGEQDTFAAIAALDALRQEPECVTCRDELRQRVWPLLARPLAKPVARPRATPTGNAYLDALQREARP